MLPIVLVLFVATSAFAAPSVLINQVRANDVPLARDNGKLISSYLTERSWDLVDGGDTNIYILTVQQILNDLANKPDSASQAHAVGQTLAVLGEILPGNPGDACAAASLINAYTSGKDSRQALKYYVQQLASTIDLLVASQKNPEVLRYASGPRSGCQGGGKSYNFEKAWDVIINKANTYQFGLANEAYSTAKSMYCATSTRSNNVGAAITAAALTPTAEVLEFAGGHIANLLRVVAQGRDGSVAGEKAKQAIYEAASRF